MHTAPSSDYWAVSPVRAFRWFCFHSEAENAVQSIAYIFLKITIIRFSWTRNLTGLETSVLTCSWWFHADTDFIKCYSTKNISSECWNQLTFLVTVIFLSYVTLVLFWEHHLDCCIIQLILFLVLLCCLCIELGYIIARLSNDLMITWRINKKKTKKHWFCILKLDYT